MRNRDNAPVPNTCPNIDDTQRHIKEANNSMERAIEYFTDMIPLLEKLRKENDALRTWGNEQYNLAAEYEIERDDYKKELDRAKDDIYYLEQKLKEIENA